MNNEIRDGLGKIEELATALRSTLEADQMTDAENIAHSLSRVAEALDDVLESTRMNREMEAQGFGWIKAGSKARLITGKEVTITDVYPVRWTAGICFDGSHQRVFLNELEPVE
jgi:catalase (peroxidase I)